MPPEAESTNRLDRTPPPAPDAARPLVGPTRAALDLQRSLLQRLLAFACLLTLLLLAAHGWQIRQQALADTPDTAAVIQQLLNQDQPRQADVFNRESIRVDLAVLEPLARRLAFCVQVEDLWSRQIGAACVRPAPPRSGAGVVARWLEALHTPADTSVRPLLRAPGVAVGHIHVRPDWHTEASHWLSSMYLVLVGWAALAVLAAVIVRPVRRALRPADQILAAIGRLEGGDTTVRLPAFELDEFRRIANEFNSLAAQLATTRAAERRLATHLLDVREDERHYLARELHDDMGQHLTSLRADAAYLRQSLAASTAHAPLTSVLDSLCETLARMHESIQNIVHRLRPPRLEAFGLIAGLEQLIADCKRMHSGAPSIQFHHQGLLDTLEPTLIIHLYRIVQEGLTNALRHADARQIEIDLQRNGDRLRLSIRDDGKGDTAGPVLEGLGRLGIRERASALGGTVEWISAPGQGTQLRVELPAGTWGAT